MTEKEELEFYKELFEKLRPYIVLAINEYYFGKDTDELKTKLKKIGYDPEG
jgi:hypothetical protein